MKLGSIDYIIMSVSERTHAGNAGVNYCQLVQAHSLTEITSRFPCVRYRGRKSRISAIMCAFFIVRDIACGRFLVRDSVARWAGFSYQKSPARAMWLQCACSWPRPCLSKQRMASMQGAGNVTVGSYRKRFSSTKSISFLLLLIR